ncbi:MAG: hypothetical protein IJ571_06170 [Ruminococcus sp.]|nr:hypothetical protein [Ruminococcus sp.]
MDKITVEAKRIEEKYNSEPTVLTPIEELRLLDKKATQKAQITALCIGIAGTLIMGFGMSCVMVWDMMILGIIISVIGAAIAVAAYPVFKRIFNEKKAELAPRILSLSKMIQEEGAE